MTKFVCYQCAEVLATLLLCASVSAWAEEADFRFQGFANQRLTSTTGNNNFFGDTHGKLSADYSELGAGVSWRPTPKWQLSGQGIFRRGGESEKDRLEPDYYYAAYTPLESEAGHLTLKLGKIKVPYGLYNDMRDTPMTRPGILAPQSIYVDSLRQLNQAAPGVHVEAERTLGDNALTLRLSQIKPNVSGDNTYWAFLGDRNTFKGGLYSHSDEAFAGQLAFDHDGGRVRALISHAQGIARYRPGNPDNWTDGRLDFGFTALSLQWNGEQVSLSAERARNDFRGRFNSSIAAPLNQDNHAAGHSWYLQAQWRFAPRWESLLRYDVNQMDDGDPDGSQFQAATGQAAWLRYAKDWTVGLRYRLDRQWLLAAELHHVNGINWLPPADNLSNGQWNPANTSPRWNLFLLQATYQF
jgi:hypothetical protein